MMKITLAIAALLGCSSAAQLQCNNYGDDCHHHHNNCRPHRIDYDRTCENEWLDDALENDITLYGPNVVVVNLDNRREVRHYEREGIFLQTGDLLFVTGRENTCAFQEWEEPKFNPFFDYDILFPALDYDMPLVSDHGSKQEIVVLEAVGSGKTRYEIDLFWGGKEVREVELEVYVDMQPGLTVATPRHHCGCGCDHDHHDW